MFVKTLATHVIFGGNLEGVCDLQIMPGTNAEKLANSVQNHLQVSLSWNLCSQYSWTEVSFVFLSFCPSFFLSFSYFLSFFPSFLPFIHPFFQPSLPPSHVLFLKTFVFDCRICLCHGGQAIDLACFKTDLNIWNILGGFHPTSQPNKKTGEYFEFICETWCGLHSPWGTDDIRSHGSRNWSNWFNWFEAFTYRFIKTCTDTGHGKPCVKLLKKCSQFFR